MSINSLTAFKYPRESCDVYVASLAGQVSSTLPLAAARAGSFGLLNLCAGNNPASMLVELERLLAAGSPSHIGLILNAPFGEAEEEILARLDQGLSPSDSAGIATANVATVGTVDGVDSVESNPFSCGTILLSAVEIGFDCKSEIARCRGKASRIGVIIRNVEEAELAVLSGADLLVAKGYEAGGFVGEETTFVLLQRLLAKFELPIVAWGGIGWNTVAACRIAGCAGVVLDWQLALMNESPLPAKLRRRLSTADGSESIALSLIPGHYFRFLWQPGQPIKSSIETSIDSSRQVGESPFAAVCREIAETMQSASGFSATNCISSPEAVVDGTPWQAGQDIGFAPTWAKRAQSVGRVLRMLRSTMDAQVLAASRANSLGAGSGLAASHGTQFPIVQGPMTRVSDVPEFCEAVAVDGGLPFLALALMGESQVRELLETTRERMGKKPWGVGILGFVPHELRAQQSRVIESVRPPFAIIAGGRPDQAASLERTGIATYLHVPSPGMLQSFLQDGARRFVFEGRECGGHVGPRTSFVLWELMIQVLADAKLSSAECAKVHVLFAGGVHDGLGAAMVAAVAQPLVERGMKIGVLMGTAYLFTKEAVTSGAIVPAFQSICQEIDRSVTVESGPGHSIRCADTPFVKLFEKEKERLKAEKWPHEDIRERLEQLNLGRLRIAAKGVARSSEQTGTLDQLDETAQVDQGMYMLGQVAALRSDVCTIRQLHEEVSNGAGAVLSAFSSRLKEPRIRVKEPRPLDIAIIGTACLIPGADNPATLWHNVLAKFDPIQEIPADRFDQEQWFAPDSKARDKIYSKWGGFVADIAFDPLKYGIPPTSLQSIEPMQLLALELVARVLKDAGYDEHNHLRERTSVILGVGGGAGELGASYSFRAFAPRFLQNPDETLWKQLPEWTEDSFAGILLNVVAGRTTNRFDFGGMNFTVDAACASSLAAIYNACNELVVGNSDMIVVGGCDTIQNSMGYLCFAKAGALSPRGRARVFDTQADGIVISEGHGAVILKRREDAERDGDKIYAIIRGVGAASDGRSKGLTAPRMEGQIRTLQRAYETSGIDPCSVDLFEAHGTGTAVGDQTECLALQTFLESAGAAPRTAAVGSIKSSIGHTKCAAGVVGLIKTVMALQHRVLPPTMHVEQPNPKAKFGPGPLYVNSETRPWLRSSGPRRAGVSSFGFGGTNFHTILEEYVAAAPARGRNLRQELASELFVFGAASEVALQATLIEYANQLDAALNAGHRLPLHRLAYSVHLRYTASNSRNRVAFVAQDPKDLLAKLRAWQVTFGDGNKPTGKSPRGVFYTREPMGPSGVACIFPGQGSQTPNMLRDLAIEFHEVSEALEQAELLLAPLCGESLLNLIYPPPSFTDAERATAVERLKATRIAQPALGACGLAMFRLLQTFGIQFETTLGHSFGELVALCAAGSLSPTQLHTLAAARGQAMTQNLATMEVPPGQMLAVGTDAATAQRLLAGIQDIWLANRNSPQQTVFSGTKIGVSAAIAKLEEQGVSARVLPVSAAFHSPMMNDARQRFREVLEETKFESPCIPVYSNVTAERFPDDGSQIRNMLADQLTSEVRWVEEIESAYRHGARIFIETGPKSVLTNLIGSILGDRPHVAIDAQPTGVDGVTGLCQALAQLLVHGVSVNLERLYDERSIEPLALNRLPASPTPVYGAHEWLVNSAYSRPASTPPRNPLPNARLASGSQSVVKSEPARSTSPVVGAIPSDASASQTTDSVIHKTGGDGHSPSPRVGPATRTEINHKSNGTSAEPNAVHQNNRIANQNGHHKEMTLPARSGDSAPKNNASNPPQKNPRNGRSSDSTTPNRTESVGAGHSQGDPREFSTGTESMASGADKPSQAFPKNVSNGTAFDAAAYQMFQETMRQFLETQESVMSRFLGAELIPTRPAPVAKPVELRRDLPTLPRPQEESVRQEINGAVKHSIPETTQSAVADSSRFDVAPTAPEVPSVPDMKSNAAQIDVQVPLSQTPVLSLESLTNCLFDVVKDRTGYPAEMLSLDANLEADLGIDSIKRVEIISTFRREVLADHVDVPANLMEQLTAARSMRFILDVVSGLLVQEARPNSISALTSNSVAPPQPQLSPAITVTLEQLSAALVQIVADRTGYPPEMLELDSKLEADLGVDSIKRVEIITAFNRDVLSVIPGISGNSIEDMLTARTMVEIVNCVTLAAPATAVAGATSVTLPVNAISAPAKNQTLDGDELLLTLMHIVADRTGYPVEMLDAAAKLEADLGIDSIKRVEIISVFRQHTFANGMEPNTDLVEKLTTAKSMADIVRYTCEARQASSTNNQTMSAQAPTVSSTVRIVSSENREPSLPQECPRCIAVCTDAPFSSDLLVFGPGAILITDDDRGVAEAVAKDLQSSGRHVVHLTAPELQNRDVLTAVIGETRRQHGRIAAVIHLLPLNEAPEFPGISAADWNRYSTLEVNGLLFLLQSISPELSSPDGEAVHVLAITVGGGDFKASVSAEAAQPWRGGVTGLLKVAAQEWPRHFFRAVDVDALPDKSLVLHELVANGPVEIGHRLDRRLAVHAERQELKLEDVEHPPIDAESIIIVTGGAQGITAEIVKEIASHVPATFILLGRSVLPDELESSATATIMEDAPLRAAIIAQFKLTGRPLAVVEIEKEMASIKSRRAIRRTLSEVRDSGARAKYLSCDVSNATSVKEALTAVQQEFGKIDGLIHGAGIIDDRLMIDKTQESFARVVRTKVDSLLELLNVIPTEQLRLVVLFASVSGFFGNTGQCDYAAANEILNRCGRRLSSRTNAKVISLNWGPWADTGMVTPEVAGKMRKNGVALIDPQSGRTAAWREIQSVRHHDVRVILGPGPWVENPIWNMASSRNHAVNGKPGLAGASVPRLLSVNTPMLFGHKVEQQVDGSLIATILLQPAKLQFLSDHVIDGRPVLPLAIALSIAAEVASAGLPGWHVVGVEDLHMLSGIIVSEPSLTIQVHAKMVRHNVDQTDWQIRITSVNSPRTLYRAVVKMARAAPAKPQAPKFESLTSPAHVSVAEAYESHLFHGPLYQVIDEMIGGDELGFDAIVRPTCPKAMLRHDVDPWLIDGIVIDACAQLALLWSIAVRDTVMLPVRLGRYTCYETIGDQPVTVRMRMVPSTDPHSYRAEIWIVRDGRVLGHIAALEGVGSPQHNRLVRGVTR